MSTLRDLEKLQINIKQPNLSAFDTVNQAINKTVQVQIAEVFDSFSLLGRTVVSQFVQTFSSTFSDFLSSLISDMTEISEVLRKTIQPLMDYYHYSEQVREAFLTAGWPISSSIPNSIQQKIVELHETGKNQYTSNVILGYFRRSNYSNLKQMVARWHGNPYFEKASYLIDEAFENHYQGRYSSSIALLLPIIEGIITDFIFDKNNNSNINWASPLKKSKEFVGDLEEYGFDNYVAAAVFLHLVEESLYKKALSPAELPKPENKRIKNRHTILHGITYSYGSQSLSLKQFIILDAIFDLLEANTNA